MKCKNLEERDKGIVDAYCMGIKPIQILKLFDLGVNYCTIYSALRKYGIEYRQDEAVSEGTKKYHNKQLHDDKVALMLEHGMSVKDVAYVLGENVNTVYNAKYRNGNFVPEFQNKSDSIKRTHDERYKNDAKRRKKRGGR